MQQEDNSSLDSLGVPDDLAVLDVVRVQHVEVSRIH